MTAQRATTPVVRCRLCDGPLVLDDGTARCLDGHVAASLRDIIDCRGAIVGFDVDADRRLAEELADMPTASFEDLLRHYWSRQAGVAPDLVERFVHGDLIGTQRAVAVADQISEVVGRATGPETVVLEIGAGTAALGTVLARRAAHVVATDIGLAWLVLAARRLADDGVANVTLVAATADDLPFGPDEFDLVVAADVIEHVPDPLVMARSCYRVLRPGGALWLSTPNRFSLTPEPHVRVWGVGFLPRSWGRRLVQRVRGVRYDDVHTHSVLQLRRTLAATRGTVRVSAPAIAPAVQAGYPAITRRLIAVYDVARRVPFVRQLLLAITPLFHAVVEKRS